MRHTLQGHRGGVQGVLFSQDGSRLLTFGTLGTWDWRDGGILGLGGSTVTVPIAAVRGLGPKVVTVEVPREAPHT